MLLMPVVARAERVMVLPLRSEVALDATVRAEAQDALAYALNAERFEVAMDVASEPCPDAACVAVRLGEAGAQHAVELVLWRAPEGAISGVSVSILERTGERFSEGAQVASDGGLRDAVIRATHGAAERQRRGPGPWLEVQGSPDGAAITIDGQAAGALPRRVKVSGGLHRVVVSSGGYEPLEQTITVPRNPDALKLLEVELRVARDAGDRGSPTIESSPWNYAIAGVAVAAGVVLGIGPIRSAAQDGECGRKRSGVCTGVVTFDGGEGAQLAGAGLLVAGGVAFAIWSPITVHADDNGARLIASGHF